MFKNQDDSEPYFTYTFNPEKDRTGDIWHVFIEGVKPGTLYLYRADGPFAPEKGHRFNKNIYLLDPYAKALTSTSLFKNLPPGYVTPTDNMDIQLGKVSDAKWFPKCVVVVDDSFDWQGDRPLNYPLRKSILYETHVRGAWHSSLLAF